jgi:isoleucyl-tRNA synthetase
MKYKEYKTLDLPKVASDVLEFWKKNDVFEKSISSRDENKPFVFFEGPPSANGLPGIHHVISRTIKDLFNRYKTLKGYRVNRKAGWDTHGLPIELGVEKELGITKEDIGKKISIEDYNIACKKAVMRYTDIWNDLTEKMGYWVNMDDPYITYDPKYMESVWWLLKNLYNKDLIYKGYTIQPYSPKAGTGLSSHELNMPGAYQDVKDTTVVAQFLVKEESLPKLRSLADFKGDAHIMAWTTTPWTLPSNTALAVGKNIDYVMVKSYNQYTFKAVNLILAKNLVGSQFNKNYFQVESEEALLSYKEGDKKIPFYVSAEFKGSEMLGIRYHQLLAYALPYENAENAFQVIPGNFVTTEDGTGIVHIAPTFGSDDAQVASENNVPPMLVLDENNNPVPLVDLQGKFRPEMKEFGGKYVKNEYYADGEAPEKSIDVMLAIKLKEENKAFNVAKYEHNYPHCWRTNKPILYYPLDSWFVKAKSARERMMELNNTINWKPKATGTGRFGNWLENVNDWNLSRSRYWGIPLPIWRTEDGSEEIIIGSVEELIKEIEKAIAAGLMKENPYKGFKAGDMSKENYSLVDLHKHIVDKIVLLSPKGAAMHRESDLIDVWFDSGSMPYAQWHYPFENKELIDEGKAYPADFIAEGVDQTRGWFYTLHAIATMVFDSVAYKTVVSNGLVLDKNGQKMSKSLGNAADPFETLGKYGPDATRWYMITNAQPWDNLKFDTEGIVEVQRKLFGTLYNTYNFFVLYANIDEFTYAEEDIAYADRPEIDRWILSRLNSLKEKVDEAYQEFEPTRVGRLIQNYVIEELSNWYVRLSRRRFWKGDYSADKISAYQTLHTCLKEIAIMMSPIAPFYADQLYRDLAAVSAKNEAESVHLSDFPLVNKAWIDEELEARMELAQKISSMVLSLRKKEKIKVRQPLQKIMIPLRDAADEGRIRQIEDLIRSEVNVKEIELIKDASDILVKDIKPNFKTIGPKYGKHMKAISAMTAQWGQAEIAKVEENEGWKGEIQGENVILDLDDFTITTHDIPGWLVAVDGHLTVALDISLNEALINEGITRELVNRIQNVRKESGLEVTDKIDIFMKANDTIENALNSNLDYLKSEVLANDIRFEMNDLNEEVLLELEEGSVSLSIRKSEQ